MRIKVLSGALLFLLFSWSVGHGQNSTFMRLAKIPGLNFGLSFIETADGGMIGTGQDDGAGGHGICDLFVHKIDECGVTEWYKRYGGAAEDGGKFVTQLADGGYAIAGLCASSGAGSYDLWLLRLDGDGNLLWSKTFGGGAGDHGRAVAQAPNGDLLLCGFINAPRAVLYRVDLNGNIVWQKQFDLNAGVCNYVEFFANGDILAVGDFAGPYGGRDVFISRLDGAGNLLWAKQFGTNGNDGYEWDLTGTIGSNGFVISATMSGFGTDQDMTISRFDNNGTLQWAKRLWGAGVDKTHFVNQTDDGGYIQSGTTNSWGFGDYDVIVNRYDPSGNHLWSKLYGGPGIDKGWGVQQTSDNGYLISTLTTSFGALYYDPMFIKTDSVGNLVDCPNFQTPPVSVEDAVYSITDFSFNIADVNHFTSDYTPSSIELVPDEELVCFSCVNEPEFIVSDTVLCQGESLYIINETTVGLVCAQEWFIADSLGAGISTLPGTDTAVYIFDQPGLYNIVLSANCGGIINSDTIDIFVLPKPIPGFEFTDACINDQPVIITDTSLVDPIQWDWSFGDGNTAAGESVQHSYTDSGFYDIELVVTNFWTCSDTITQQIRISDKPLAAYTFTDTCFGGANNFVDQSVPNDGVITNYDWNFGDIQTSTDQNPSHTYATDGTYPVELIVTTDNGCTGTLVQDVESYALPQDT
ncbi:MAG: PKD domain-containing protein [Flavobacteriales bacterium]|nr:PKD domain-containing protein [Flavobacteriales bacterium]